MLFRKKPTHADGLDDIRMGAPLVITFVNKAIADALNAGAAAMRIDVVKWDGSREVPADLGYEPSKETVSEIESARVQFLKNDAWVDHREYRMAFHPVVVNRIRAMAGVDYWKKNVDGKVKIAVNDVWYDVASVFGTAGF